MHFDTDKHSLAMRVLAERYILYFTRYFHKVRERSMFELNWHHIALARAIDDVVQMRIPRLIINLPPGFTKSMMLLDAIGRSYGTDPLTRNILLSYNSTFARSQSQIIMDTLELPEYQSWWNVKLRHDVSAKGRWITQGKGGMVAQGVRGTILGFRAGRITPGYFSGGLWADDPMKPQEAHSKLERDKVNSLFMENGMSRLSLPETPVTVVAQRLHDNDLSGYLLRGGSGEEWTHLCIPGRMTKEFMKPGKAYARRYPYGKPLIYPDLFQKGFTWPIKYGKKQEKTVRKAQPYIHAAQIQQSPMLADGNFIKTKWLHFYDELPDKRYFNRIVAIMDTALEKNKDNDRTVWTVWGGTRQGPAYLLDYWGAQMEVPEVEATAARVWERWRETHVTGLPRIQAMHIEKKASGHGVIQRGRKSGINVVAIERNVDKVYRAHECIPALTTGTLLFPARKYRGEFTQNRQWAQMMDEIAQFSGDLSHLHDDYCDTIFDAANIFYDASTTVRQLTR